MASAKDIKRRIRSVKNTSQITKAMEVVSATKMRRSQTAALSGRPYAVAALDILSNISRRMSSQRTDQAVSGRWLAVSAGGRRGTNGRVLLAVITSDKGLAGAFNSNVLRLVERWRREHDGEAFDVATVGKKARDYFMARGIAPVASFTGFGDYAVRLETEPLADVLAEGYAEGRWKSVAVFYTNFRSTLKQESVMVEVLPADPRRIEEIIRGITPEYGLYSEKHKPGAHATNYSYEYKFEPSAEAVLDKLLPVLFKIQMHHIVLESNASEHSARMVAMKNASENAEELIGELTIEYNKSRQAGITGELTEITAGKEALEI